MLLCLDDWSHYSNIHTSQMLNLCLSVAIFSRNISKAQIFFFFPLMFFQDLCSKLPLWLLHCVAPSIRLLPGEDGRLGRLSCSRQLHKDSFIYGRGRSLANAACVKRVLIAHYWCIWLIRHWENVKHSLLDVIRQQTTKPTDAAGFTPAVLTHRLQHRIQYKWKLNEE